jgi:D-tyrosyl-tRNA(Tyr) deacylase
MRAVVQRVRWARVKVNENTVGEIGRGVLVLLGAGQGDGEQDVDYVAGKVVNLRIFEDEQHSMNRSLLDVGGAVLVVSQFTLYGDCRKGRRPSFIHALAPEEAERLCDLFARRCEAHGLEVRTGRFGAMMDVELSNSGPVTMLLDSRKQF